MDLFLRSLPFHTTKKMLPTNSLQPNHIPLSLLLSALSKPTGFLAWNPNSSLLAFSLSIPMDQHSSFIILVWSFSSWQWCPFSKKKKKSLKLPKIPTCSGFYDILWYPFLLLSLLNTPFNTHCLPCVLISATCQASVSLVPMVLPAWSALAWNKC